VKFLLDTHTFIWMDTNKALISPPALGIITDTVNTLFLSYASIWEMQIKIGIGKLQLTTALQATIQTQMQSNRLELLPVQLDHIFTLDRLPSHHRDPFDRLLIAQAIWEGIPILSHDSMLAKYPIVTLW
jgi:PIN domain nuclease of toxin-antitoxin system